jgi:hypothetical protein
VNVNSVVDHPMIPSVFRGVNLCGRLIMPEDNVWVFLHVFNFDLTQ